MAAPTTKKGRSPYSHYNADGTKKTPEEIRKLVAEQARLRYHRMKKEGKLTKKRVPELNGDGIASGKTRWTIVVRTGPNLYRVFITGVGEFVAKRASVRI